MSLDVKLSAWLRDGRRIERVLSERDYFDPVESDEPIEVETTPIHIDARDYLDLPHAEICAMRIDLADEAAGRRRLLELRFWGRHRASYVADYVAGRLIDWEHILQIREHCSDALHVVNLGPPTDRARAGVISHTRCVGDDGEELASRGVIPSPNAATSRSSY